VACAALAALAAPSSALQVMCTTNPNGTRSCQGTDSFIYDGMNQAGCPSGAYPYETFTIEENVPPDATNITGRWGIDPATICGGLTDTSGTSYTQGDALRGGAFKVDEHGNYVLTQSGERTWVWTVRAKGKDPGGDHPVVVVDVTYDRPPASTGGGGNGGGNTGGGTTGSTGSGICDWSVAFDNPPKQATSVPVGYHLVVHNAGTGSCPETTLKLQHAGGVGTTTALLVAGAPGSFVDPLGLIVPALAPGGSVRFDVLARATIDDLGLTGNRIRLRASLRPDHDSPDGSDEVAIAKTKLKPKQIDVTGGKTDGHGHGMLTLDCPAGEHAHDRCLFKLDIPDTPLPQERLLFPPLGSAHGTVPAGLEGKIDFGLAFTERKRLAKRHEMQVTFIGTRTEDGVSRLVEGHVTLKR
jgi:hypothetical protein